MQERYKEFTSLITSIYRSIQKIKNMEVKELGLKGKQVQCLYFLYHNEEGLNSKNLALYCMEDKAAISRTLKELENKGLVFLLKKDGKIYKNHYKLTDLGKENGKIIASKIDYWVIKAGSQLNEEEKNNMYNSLHQIEKSLKEIDL